MEDMNGREYLEKIKHSVIENIRRTADPSVQITSIPDAPYLEEDDGQDDDEDEDENADVRKTQRQRDAHITRLNEYEDSDDEDAEFDGNGDFVRSSKQQSPFGNGRSRITDHINPNAVPGKEDGDVLMSGANGHDDDGMEDIEEELDANDEVASAIKSSDEDVANNADVEDEQGDGMDLDNDEDGNLSPREASGEATAAVVDETNGSSDTVKDVAAKVDAADGTKSGDDDAEKSDVGAKSEAADES
jgi:histone deacetylase 1/2